MSRSPKAAAARNAASHPDAAPDRRHIIFGLIGLITAMLLASLDQRSSPSPSPPSWVSLTA